MIKLIKIKNTNKNYLKKNFILKIKNNNSSFFYKFNQFKGCYTYLKQNKTKTNLLKFVFKNILKNKTISKHFILS